MRPISFRQITTGLAVFSAALSAVAADKIDFALDVKPLLESTCLSCHGPEKPKGDLQLMTRALAIKGGENGPSMVPGKPTESKLYISTILPAGHDDIMPPKGDPLTKTQAGVLRNWIEQGAEWPESIKLEKVQRVDFVKDIQPILELNCVACHREGHDQGSLRMDERDLAFKGGDSGSGIVAFRPKASPVYTSTTHPADHDDLMPPAKKGGPMSTDKIELLARWIEQGASWLDGLKLTPKKAEEIPGADELTTVTGIYHKIMANLKEKSQADMKAYTNSIPGTAVTYSMMPIRAGEFLMGSPGTEKGRKADEGPQHKVKISPFWMGRTEVTWNEYELFMYPDQEKALTFDTNNPYLDKASDAVSRPTKPYVEMSFGMGKGEFPAISMTQHAANKYCQWLSAKTGQYYRLPTEAEWEYACRAGTTTRWSFGDDPEQLPPGMKSAAVVREMNGVGEYQKGGAGAWLPAAVGQSLHAGDKFRTVTNGRALVEFAYLAPARLGEKSSIEIRPPDWLGQHAWWSRNSDFKYQKTGRKNPNPWGLHDMHGNVMEWCLDQYEPNAYQKPPEQDSWVKSTKPYPHVARGGHWDDEDVTMLRSAVRRFSDKSWKQQDPQLPKSIWYHTDAQFLGFRVVRPLKVPPPEELMKVWNNGVEKD